MKSQINPASFTFPINEKPMKSTISSVSFTFPINEKMMKSQINQQILACNSNMERDNVRNRATLATIGLNGIEGAGNIVI